MNANGGREKMNKLRRVESCRQWKFWEEVQRLEVLIKDRRKKGISDHTGAIDRTKMPFPNVRPWKIRTVERARIGWKV